MAGLGFRAGGVLAGEGFRARGLGIAWVRYDCWPVGAYLRHDWQSTRQGNEVNDNTLTINNEVNGNKLIINKPGSCAITHSVTIPHPLVHPNPHPLVHPACACVPARRVRENLLDRLHLPALDSQPLDSQQEASADADGEAHAQGPNAQLETLLASPRLTTNNSARGEGEQQHRSGPTAADPGSPGSSSSSGSPRGGSGRSSAGPWPPPPAVAPRPGSSSSSWPHPAAAPPPCLPSLWPGATAVCAGDATAGFIGEEGELALLAAACAAQRSSRRESEAGLAQQQREEAGKAATSAAAPAASAEPLSPALTASPDVASRVLEGGDGSMGAGGAAGGPGSAQHVQLSLTRHCRVGSEEAQVCQAWCLDMPPSQATQAWIGA